MANLKASKKDVIRTKRNRLRNQHYTSMVKTRIKNAVDAINANHENANELLKVAQKAIDQVAAKGIIHKNTAARKKSSLMKKLNQVNVNQTPVEIQKKKKTKTTKNT